MSKPMEEDANGKTEEEEFNTGPLSVLMMNVKNNTQEQPETFWTSKSIRQALQHGSRKC